LFLFFGFYGDLLSAAFGFRPENERVDLFIANPTLTDTVQVQVPGGGTGRFEVVAEEPGKDEMAVAVVVGAAIFQRRGLDLFELDPS
jgi:hypothetical protein